MPTSVLCPHWPKGVSRAWPETLDLLSPCPLPDLSFPLRTERQLREGGRCWKPPPLAPHLPSRPQLWARAPPATPDSWSRRAPPR